MIHPWVFEFFPELKSSGAARQYSEASRNRYREFASHDPRLNANPVPDALGKSSGFSVSKDEFISGVPSQVADEIRDQCQRTGAGDFLSVLHWGAGFGEVAAAHRLFGEAVIPALQG